MANSIFVLMGLLQVVLVTQAMLQVIERLQFGTVFTDKGFLTTTGSNNFNIAVHVPLPPIDAIIRSPPEYCATDNSTEGVKVICGVLQHMINSYIRNRQLLIKQIDEIREDIASLIPSFEAGNKRNAAQRFRWLLGIADRDEQDRIADVLDVIQGTMNSNIKITQIRNKELDTYLDATSGVMEGLREGIVNNSKALAALHRDHERMHGTLVKLSATTRGPA